MTQQLSILPLLSYRITIQFSYSPFPSAGNPNYSFPNSSDNVFISHPAKHKNPAVITHLFRESLCKISDQNFWTPVHGGHLNCLCGNGLSKGQKRFLIWLFYISFLWISLWISGKPLLSTHQELLSPFYPSGVGHAWPWHEQVPSHAGPDEWTTCLWLMCRAVLSIFTRHCLLKKR